MASGSRNKMIWFRNTKIRYTVAATKSRKLRAQGGRGRCGLSREKQKDMVAIEGSNKVKEGRGRVRTSGGVVI